MIGNDVWIMCESVIMSGVKIEAGAMIMAYSIVAKGIPPYTVDSSNSVRFIRRRFDDDLTELPLQLKWWALPGEELAEILSLLCNPDLDAVKAEFHWMLGK